MTTLTILDRTSYEVCWHGALWRDYPAEPVVTLPVLARRRVSHQTRILCALVGQRAYAPATVIAQRAGGKPHETLRAVYRLAARGLLERAVDETCHRSRYSYRRVVW